MQRDDLLGQMIKLKNDGFKNGKDGKIIRITLDEMAAQSFAFFMGGTKTASATMAFALCELAQPENGHMQEKARCEINAVLQNYSDDLTFEALHEMPYVEAIANGKFINQPFSVSVRFHHYLWISETLRKYPPIPYLTRLITSEYTCAKNKVTIPKNVSVIIPTFGIHHDSQIYDSPEEFRPERFIGEELKEKPSVAFLPFGAGPRNCIAFRMGSVQVRCSLVMLLKHFTFSTCDQTIAMPSKFHPRKISLTPERQIILKVQRN